MFQIFRCVPGKLLMYGTWTFLIMQDLAPPHAEKLLMLFCRSTKIVIIYSRIVLIAWFMF